MDVVGGDHYAEPLICHQLMKHIPNLPLALDIQAQGRLVQNEQTWLVNQNAQQLRPEPLAQRQCSDPLVQIAVTLQQRGISGQISCKGLFRHFVNALEQPHTVEDRQVINQVGFAAQVNAELGFVGAAEGSGRFPHHGNLSGGGTNHPQQHFDQGAFSRPVGAENADDFPGLDGKIHIPDGISVHALVLFAEFFHFDDRFHPGFLHHTVYLR